MAKTKKSDAVLTLPVKYGKVSIGEAIASVPITMQLSDLSLNSAYKQLCGKRITGQIMARSGGAQAKQASLMEGSDLEIEGAFDIKSFSFNKKKISTTISFSLESISIEDLAHFAKREGILTATGIDEIPEKDDEDDDDEEEEDD